MYVVPKGVFRNWHQPRKDGAESIEKKKKKRVLWPEATKGRKLGPILN